MKHNWTLITKHFIHIESLNFVFYVERLCYQLLFDSHLRGEAKCWYGVPGSAASAFEKVSFFVLQVSQGFFHCNICSGILIFGKKGLVV